VFHDTLVSGEGQYSFKMNPEVIDEPRGDYCSLFVVSKKEWASPLKSLALMLLKVKKPNGFIV
jgi:hypothetical protein